MRSAAQHRRLVTLALAALALAVTAGAVYAAWPASSRESGHQSAAAAPSRPGQPASAGTGSAQPAPQGPAQLPSGGVALKPRNPGHVVAWNTGPGGAALSALSADVGTVLIAHGPGRFVQMKDACVSLAAAVATASVRPPIPDPAMETHYRQALTSLTAGATDCRAAISWRPQGDEGTVTTTSPALLARARSELDAGIRYLNQATDWIKTLEKA